MIVEGPRSTNKKTTQVVDYNRKFDSDNNDKDVQHADMACSYSTRQGECLCAFELARE